jgi:zinc protease
VTPFINEIAEGIVGGSTPQDIEAMFQLIHLRFTQPRADPIVFTAMASQARALLANRTASPEVVFNQVLEAALSQNSPRRQPETAATVDLWNLDKALAFYKARFADASNFTFVFVGSFTPESIKPFVETYIASLPATHAHETLRDLGIVPPRGVVNKTVEKGIAPKSAVSIVLSGPFEYDDAHRLALRAMTLVLQSRLSDAIRQELGGTYSITAAPDSEKFPHPQYSVRIDWTCDPARTAALVQRVFEELEFLKATRLSPEQMALLRTALVREFDLNSQDNAFLLEELSRRYENGDTAAVVSAPNQIAALTATAMRLAAETYLDTQNYVKVTLMPESR